MNWSRASAAALLLLIAVVVLAAGQTETPQPADLVLKNGAIYTVDAARRWADAMAIKGSRIVYVGSGRGVESFVGPSTKIVDLTGRMVLPGFHDSHVHPVSAGIELNQCDLNDARTVNELVERVRACARAKPGTDWIVGGGWDLTLFPAANPSKATLDAVVDGRPVYLSSSDGHSAWVNSRALAVAGITRDTPDPPRGRIERDPGSRNPSGTLREAAVALVRDHIPPSSAAEYREGLRVALQRLAAVGLVSFQEADASRQALQAYLEADREGWLTARVRASLQVNPGQDTEQVADLVELRRAFHGRRLEAGSAKFFVDGVIEAKTSALLEPYRRDASGIDADPPNGPANYAPDRLQRLVTALDGEGFQVHLHAIGDRAVRMGLDAIESSVRANGVRDARHHIAHLELIDPADIGRFARLGVVANFQPLWAYADRYITDLTEPILGPERSKWLYPIRSVMDSGAVVAAGSDWSVSSPNPLAAIEVAVTRRAPGAAPGQGWLPEQQVDLSRMIAAYTIAGAYVNFEERDSGSLEPGKLADFIVLDRNLFAIPPNEIHAAKVLWTVMEGKETYRSPEKGVGSLFLKSTSVPRALPAPASRGRPQAGEAVVRALPRVLSG